ncbi:MAG: BTAD domain-containing putative transcriptional regulator [Ktedonobacteraceae bacterium]
MQEASTPLLRVYLFGEFQLIWQVPSCMEEAVWDSRTSARALFKLLLCAPGRQATKSMLAGILWPETDEEKARESLRSACKVLRKVLRTAAGEELLELPRTDDTLRLAEQTRLWVDADAFEAVVSQASRVHSSDAALALWEEANALLRGEFLAQDQSAEWLSHRLVKRRRQVLWMARCRMIRHLADLYVQRGRLSLAEETLELHVAHFPTDQDALYRLLVLLEQRGCFEQASILYERTRRTLEAVGKQPGQHVRACYERFQQLVSSRSQTLPFQKDISSLETVSELGGQFFASHAPVVTPALSRCGLEGSEGGLIGSMTHVFSLLGTDGRLDARLNVLRVLLEPEGEGRQDMSLLSRRQLLELGIAALISNLAQVDSKRISVVEREELSRALGESIANAWRLFHIMSNTEILAVGQIQLSLIHKAHALLLPSTRYCLYAGAYGLKGLALHFQERHEEALHTYHHAHLAAVATGDSWFIAQALICQADTYLALGMYAEALHVIEEALLGLGEIDEEHRRARAHLLGCWADVSMSMKEYSFAQKKLDEAAHYLDEVTVIEEFDRSCWLQLAGKKALMAGEYQQAVDHLEEALAANPPHWLLRHVGILTPLAMAYARMQEQEKSLFIAQQATPIVGAVNAPMTNKHFLEYIKDDILGRFPHDNKSHTFLTEIRHQLPHLPALVDAS